MKNFTRSNPASQSQTKKKKINKYIIDKKMGRNLIQFAKNIRTKLHSTPNISLSDHYNKSVAKNKWQIYLFI